MGREIDRVRFDESDYARFGARLEEGLAALRRTLRRPGFGEGAASLGAELELSLVDAAGRPRLINQDVVAGTRDPRITQELNLFNVECNLRHGALRGAPLAAFRAELESALAEVRRVAGAHGGRVAMIGILPTLEPGDLDASVMTPAPRYRALSAALQRRRHEPFHVQIDGADPLDVDCEDVTFEGAATSLQVHLRVDPADFARTYNGVQMATAPVLAAACNSPTFLGHRLWDETRVALFKQAVDDRSGPRRRTEARVSFGTGWLLDSAYELFVESVALHDPLLPIVGEEAPLERVEAGEVPRLEELRLHVGTVWRWNRPIYDPSHGGHLRIEMRALPAGPSVADMVANVAFLVGLGLGLAPDCDGWTRSLPFEVAHSNSYRAAQQGLAAELQWPAAPGGVLQRFRAADLVLRLLPTARHGLELAGVEAEDFEPWLGVIEERAARGCSGAVWQRSALAQLEPRRTRGAALAAMLERYLENAGGGEPVHRWPGVS